MFFGADPSIGGGGLLGGVALGGAPAPPLGTGFLPDATVGNVLPVPPAIPADVWGTVTIPTCAPGTGDSAGDRALGFYLAYLKAFLQTDRAALALWSAPGVAPNKPAVVGVHAHNPSDAHDDRHGIGFSTSDLPALYLWRQGGQFERIADDILLEKSTWTLLWVYPLDVESKNRARAPAANAIAKCLVTAMERGRTPSFVVPGDPDPVAERFGSFVHKSEFTNVWTLVPREWARARVLLTGAEDGTKDDMYPAVQVTFDVEENLEVDPRIWTDPAGIEQRVAVGSVVERGDD